MYIVMTYLSSRCALLLQSFFKLFSSRLNESVFHIHWEACFVCSREKKVKWMYERKYFNDNDDTHKTCHSPRYTSKKMKYTYTVVTGWSRAAAKNVKHPKKRKKMEEDNEVMKSNICTEDTSSHCHCCYQQKNVLIFYFIFFLLTREIASLYQ